MARWEKIKLKDARSNGYKTFFDDEYGFIESISSVVLAFDKNKDGQRLSYKKDDRWEYVEDFETLENNEVYFSGEYDPIKPKKVKIFLQLNKVGGYERINVELRKEEYDKKYIYANKDNVNEYFRPVFMDLKIGDKYFYIGRGICEIVELYEYPNQKNKLCQIKDLKNSKIDVTTSDSNFVCLPYNYVDELEQFDASLDERQLQPIVKRGDNLINVLWQPIGDAAGYRISLYKYRDEIGERKVYLMETKTMERNQFMCRFNELTDTYDLIVVVEALDRQEKVIARSRGIKSEEGVPQWWTD